MWGSSAGLQRGWVQRSVTGANDVANAIGPAVGSRALRVRTAVILAALFELLGAALVGDKVSSTISDKILDANIDDKPFAAGTLAPMRLMHSSREHSHGHMACQEWWLRSAALSCGQRSPPTSPSLLAPPTPSSVRSALTSSGHSQMPRVCNFRFCDCGGIGDQWQRCREVGRGGQDCLIMGHLAYPGGARLIRTLLRHRQVSV